MPRALKVVFKYKCLEVLCNTVHRQDKWIEHCRKKHVYKFKSNIDIKYKVVESKQGDGKWEKIESVADAAPIASSRTVIQDDSSSDFSR